MKTISALSTEFLRYEVDATLLDNTYNPTADTVQFAFTASNVAPVGGTTWYTGSWESNASRYVARVLVGPGVGGVITLAAGLYDVWLKVTDNPEVPLKKGGPLTVV